jgi:hypothetical protein
VLFRSAADVKLTAGPLSGRNRSTPDWRECLTLLTAYTVDLVER